MKHVRHINIKSFACVLKVSSYLWCKTKRWVVFGIVCKKFQEEQIIVNFGIWGFIFHRITYNMTSVQELGFKYCYSKILMQGFHYNIDTMLIKIGLQLICFKRNDFLKSSYLQSINLFTSHLLSQKCCGKIEINPIKKRL